MKAKHRRASARILDAKARRHERAAEALGQAAARFTQVGGMHGVEFIKARAQAEAARSTGGHEHS